MTETPEIDHRADEKLPRSKTLAKGVPRGGDAVPGARALPVTGDYLRRLKIGRLDSPADYRRAMNKCIRGMARGILPRELGTGLVWALTQAANEARKELEERVFNQLVQLESEQRADAPRAQLADDLTGEALAEIMRRGRPALEMLPSDTDEEGL